MLNYNIYSTINDKPNAGPWLTPSIDPPLDIVIVDFIVRVRAGPNSTEALQIRV